LIVVSAGFAGLVVLAYPLTRVVDRETAAKLAVLAPRIAILEGLGIFAATNRAALERLAAAAEERAEPAGTRIVQEGDPADALYVISSGQVAVSAVGETAAAAPVRLRTMGPGEYFGEIGLIENVPRTASVDATSDVALLRLPGDVFLEALTENHASAAFMEGARMRLARTHPSQELTGRAVPAEG
jgi:CRP-like cAMP-binding protein